MLRARCRALYEALEVKYYFTAFFTFFDLTFFLHPSFFVRLGSPFLRPDPHVLDAGARRAVKAGRRSALTSRSIVSRLSLDSPEHGGTLVVSG